MWEVWTRCGFGPGVEGFEFRVWCLGSGVWGLRVWGLRAKGIPESTTVKASPGSHV